MRVAIGAVVIRENSLLIVKKRNSWILPGGKIEEGESDLECLSREVGEELSGTKICNEIFYGEFEGRTPHRGDILKSRVYFAGIDGPLRDVYERDSISEVRWVENFERYNLSKITSKIVDSLKKDRYLE